MKNGKLDDKLRLDDIPVDVCRSDAPNDERNVYS